MEYMIEFDGIYNCGTEYWDAYTYDGNFAALIADVKDVLKGMGGGHADIYDEDGNFVEDVEV